MKHSRSARLGGVAIVGALALAACGSDNNSGTSATTGAPGAASSSAPAVSGNLTGEGSSAQKNAIDEAIASFTQANSGAQVTYNATGSGAGIKQFNAGQADWAGSDSALKKDPAEGSTTSEVAAAKQRCQGNDAWNLPMIAGPIAVAYNLEGVDKLVLTPSVAAKIFLGKITTWNDPAIAEANPDAQLPDTAITPVHRGDDSGTTDNFTDYLFQTAPDVWTSEPDGVWPLPGGEAANGTSGVVGVVESTVGAVTYADASRAGDLGVVSVAVGEEFVAPSAEAAAAIVENSPRVEGRGEYDFAIELNRQTEGSGEYPIVLVSYHLGCVQYDDQAAADNVKAFMSYVISEDGQAAAAENAGNAPISDTLRSQAQPAVDAISAG